jgi:hypothetical protein
MGKSERRKGVAGEAEVLAMYRARGFEIRGLERGGDHLAIGHGLIIHSESKRQEVCRPWLWGEQLLRDAAPEALPILAMRRSRSPWFGLSPLAALLDALTRE